MKYREIVLGSKNVYEKRAFHERNFQNRLIKAISELKLNQLNHKYCLVFWGDWLSPLAMLKCAIEVRLI